ncbi:MAG: hypothetical protein E7300_02410 [Lachnospiraceae bacterium]|nr:hypothetical protein [Lachnospiraceae bacterium]
MINITFLTSHNLEMFRPFIPTDLSEWLFLGPPIMLGAVSDEAACGFLLMVCIGDQAEIRTLTVAEGYDRDDVMEALVSFSGDHLEAFGIRSLSAVYEGDEDQVVSMDRAYLAHGFSLRLERCYRFRIRIRDVLASDMARRLANNRVGLSSEGLKPLKDVPGRYLNVIPNPMQVIAFEWCDPNLSYAYIEDRQVTGLLLVRKVHEHLYSLEDLYTVRINPMAVVSLVGAVMHAAATAVKERRIDASSELIFQMTEERGVELPEKLLHILPESSPRYHIAELVPQPYEV